MAKTTQLAAAALPLTGAELIPIVQAGVSRKVTAQSLAALGGDKGDPGGDASQVGTRLQAETMNFAAGIDMIRTTGFATRGDGGAATYVRWAVPMTALVANQNSYSWFQSADGAQWVLSGAVLRPEMFGAIGHATNDEGLPIRRTFEAAPGKKVIVTKAHRYKSVIDGVDAIRIYSNTKVQGISALTCGFKRIPNLPGESLSGYGIFWQDADCIEINDIFHDVQRSGLGEAANRRVNGFVSRGRNTRIRLNRLRVLNATGYAFYVSAVTTDFTVDYVATDCVAINSQVSFEVTGKNTEATFIRPQSLQYVTDGGSAVNYECGYHQYGGIAKAYHEKPFHRGAAPAVLTVMVEDGVEHRGVVYDDPDFEISLPGIATVIVRNDYYSVAAHPGNGKRAQADFIGGRVVNLTGPASDFTTSLVDIDGTQFIGRTAALSAGAFSVVSLRGDFDIQAIEPVTASAGAAALGAVIDNNAVCTRTPSGSISATHLNGGPQVAVSGTIALVADTIFDPPNAVADTGINYPKLRQYKTAIKVIGLSGSADVINVGLNATTNKYEYWSVVVFDQVAINWDKVKVDVSVQGKTDNDIVHKSDISWHWYRKPDNGDGAVFVALTSDQALTADDRFHYEILERM